MTDRTETLSPLKQALLQLREMRARLEEVEQARSEPIAVIGLGLRLPGGAHDPVSFWRLLRDGVDAVSEVPADRWDIDAFYDPRPETPGKMTTRYGAFLEGIDRFEPAFFGISPREAVSMDPQQRLLLEVCWEALEHGGQSPERLAESDTGVFLGMANSDYLRLLLADPLQIDTYTSTGGAASVAAGRLSYLLGLHGPNLAVDTACSSSLVAVHLAVRSLRHRDCRLALAGGVNLILSPEININFSKAQGMLAPDGRCKTFDARADGYVRGEGCAAVALKRLSDARADGDPILAVIRGSAINHDGRTSGLTAPNGPAQTAVIRAALADGGVTPAQVGYVEAHGTGTSLGDPIEIQALGAALADGHDAQRPVWVGSAKTNFGHLEAAAGIAGLIKVVLTLQHGEIPPHLHFETPNPYIAWERVPVAVSTALTPWPADQRRIAGVSSFGFSGTNAHVILEAEPAPEPAAPGEPQRERVLALSARSETALKAQAAQYAHYLDAHPETPLADFTWSANTGRSHFGHRLAVVAASAAQARQRLAAFAAGQAPDGLFSGHAPAGSQPEIVFLFTGQGSQYAGMGRQLYETEPVFRQALQHCEALLRPYLEQPLTAVLYPEPGRESPLDEMRYAQPALFALGHALAQLWRAWGIEPAAVAGHSLGEYIAAGVAGVFSLADGLKLVATRGRLMHELPAEGAMVTVFADEARVAALLQPFAADVAIAAVNSPETVVISGRRSAVEAVLEVLKAEKIRARALPVAQASHSPLIEPILNDFARVTAEVTFSASRIPLVSGLTGQPVSAETVVSVGYWRRHFRETVRFADVVQGLFAGGYRAFVEIGPNPTLLSLAQRCVPNAGQAAWLPSLRQGWRDGQTMLESLGALYVRGAAVDWPGVERDTTGTRRRLHLPTYPWERKSYWSNAARSRAHTPPEASPRWEAAVRAGQRQAHQAPLDLEVGTYPERWRCLDRLARAYMVNTLVALGAFSKPGEAHSPDSLLAACQIRPTYLSLMTRWLKQLAGEGLVQLGPAGAFLSSQPLSALPLEPLWRAADQALADLPVLRAYVRRCGDKLAAVITGVGSPLETLFPGGSFETTEFLYQHWALARYFNHIAAAVIAAAAQSARPGRPVRLLEIGAGTGATTAALLPLLPPSQTHYHFSDVSDLFLSRAAEKFAAFPFVRYGRLDIEQPPEAQGYPVRSFDAVVAANVLHATADLRETLQRARSLLTPGGVLVLYEATTPQPWYDITTGLIEGWQRFDDGLRQDSPLLPAGQWETVLREAGFDAVEVFPEPGSPAEILGQHVIVARNLVVGAPDAGEFPIAAPDQAGDDRDQRPNAPVEPTPAGDGLLRRLQEALPSERVDVLADFVRGHVARILRLDPSDPLDRQSRLMDLGVDSLMAVELRNRLTTGLGLQRALPATLIFDHPTVAAIARYLAAEVLVFEAAAQPAPAPRLSAAAPIEELSDAEVEALLLEKLKSLPR